MVGQNNYFAVLVLSGLSVALTACGGGGDSAPATASAVAGPSSSVNSTTTNSSATNRAPTISGRPATTAIVGTAYSFQANGADADGNTLAYSRTGGLPPGLNFNTATGLLSGTPTTAGTYANIVISVNDGKGGSASLPAFTITVAATTGSAVLTWTAPTLNTDGSPLTDLTGYKVYYGLSPTSLNLSVSIPSALTTTLTIPSLPSGITYYFAIASISASGGEGNKSNPASKTI